MIDLNSFIILNYLDKNCSVDLFEADKLSNVCPELSHDEIAVSLTFCFDNKLITIDHLLWHNNKSKSENHFDYKKNSVTVDSIDPVYSKYFSKIAITSLGKSAVQMYELTYFNKR